MKNNKGLTLVEMIAVLIVLSIIAVIVTPNIYSNIKDYRTKLFEAQMDNVKEAAKNWAADNADMLPSGDCNYGLAVYLKNLQQEGFIDDNLKNMRDGGYANNEEVFALITCSVHKDAIGDEIINYGYHYGSYESMYDYLEKMAIKYSKEENKIGQVTTELLKSKNYVLTNIKNVSGNNVTIPNKTILITKADDIYSASVQ